MKFGIALVPCPKTIALIVELQQKIIPICPLEPILGSQQNLPHLTLLQGRFHNSLNWVDLIYSLRDYWRQQKYGQDFRVTQLEFKSPAWYFLILNQHEIFVDLHNFVFAGIKHHIYVTDADLNKDISAYSELEKINYLQYGYRYIGSAFHPHLTLGRSTNTNPDNGRYLVELFAAQHIIKFIIKFERITIYEMGDYGSHAATLYSVNIPD